MAEATDDIALGLSKTQGEEVLGVCIAKVAVGGEDEVLLACAVGADAKEFFGVVIKHGPPKARVPRHVSLTGACEGALDGGQEVAEEAERSARELRKKTIGDEVIIDVGAVVVPCAEKPPEVTVQVVEHGTLGLRETMKEVYEGALGGHTGHGVSPAGPEACILDLLSLSRQRRRHARRHHRCLLQHPCRTQNRTAAVAAARRRRTCNSRYVRRRVVEVFHFTLLEIGRPENLVDGRAVDALPEDLLVVSNRLVAEEIAIAIGRNGGRGRIG